MKKERRQVFFFILILLILTLFKTHTFFSQDIPAGGDFIGHYSVLSETVTIFEEMVHGENISLWFSESNTGYPLFYYYQPAAFLSTALLALPLVLISSVSILSIYKAVIIGVYLLVPVSIVVMCLLFRFTRKESFYAGLLVLFVSSIDIFASIGTFEIKSMFHYGLFTHLFALPLLAITIGLYYRLLMRTVEMEDNLNKVTMKYHVMSVIIFAALLYTHVLLAAVGGLCVFLLYCGFILKAPNKKRIITQGIVHLILLLVLVTPFLYFSITTISYYGGLDFSYDWYTDGAGIYFFQDFVKGEFLDFGSVLPIITILSIIGICFFCFDVQRKDEKEKRRAICILFLFLITFLLMAGIFTPLLKKIPLIELFPIGRFVVLVQLLGVVAAGYGMAKIEGKCREVLDKRKISTRFIIFFYALIMIGLTTLPASPSYEFSFSLSDEHKNMLEFLDKQKDFTRVYIYEDMMKDASLMSELVAMQTNKPVFNTVNGFHETISVSYNWFYTRDIEPTWWLDNVFGAGYEVTYKDTSLRNYTQRIYHEKDYTVYKIPDVHLFDIVNVNAVLYTKPKKSILFGKKWLKSRMPIEKEYVMVIDEKSKHHDIKNIFRENPEDESDYFFSGSSEVVEHLTPIFSLDNNSAQYKLDIEQDIFPYNNKCDHIAIIDESIISGRYITEVTIENDVTNNNKKNCYLLLKMSMHPGWEARIKNKKGPDDQGKKEVTIVMLSPSFMGISLDELEPGSYEVEFSFKGNPLKGIILFPLFGVLLFLFAIFFDKMNKYREQTK
jgi:hypothetical protein